MTIPEAALLLAGFALAHAAWSISDVPEGELLVPLAMVEEAGQRRLVRFEDATQEEAIRKGKAAMAELTATADAWAFAREGLMPEAGGKVDVFSVDFWAKGMREPATLIQRFEPFARRGKFRVIGQPELVVKGRVQESKATEDLLPRIRAGIAQHQKVAALWDTWSQE